MVISSSDNNTNGHGSTLTFAASNPSDAADYNKFVINKGNWGTRTEMLTFAYENTEHVNPHTYINSGDNVMTLDGANKRVGIGPKSEGYTPSYPLDVNFDGDSGVRIKGHTSHASLYIDAASGSAGYIRFRRGGSPAFWITSDGSDHLAFRPNGGGTTVKFFNSGEADFYNNTQVYSRLLVQRNSTTAGVPTYSQATIEVRTTDNSSPSIGFHRSGYTASTIYESGGRLFINQNVGTDQDGRIVVSSSTYNENLFIRNSSPTLYLRDTDHNSSMVHCNSNLLYILRGANDSTGWTQVNSQWPWIWNLTNNNAIGGAALSLVGALTQNTSDRRLKENLVHIPSPLEKINQLHGYTFDWKAECADLGFTPQIQTNDVGLIAQDVQAVLPQAVAPAPFDQEWDNDLEEDVSKSGEDYLTVQYEKLVPLLVEAIKEQQTLIEALTSRIDALENP